MNVKNLRNFDEKSENQLLLLNKQQAKDPEMTIQPKKSKLKHGEFADFKLESDADEVYIPDHIMSDAEYHRGGFREKYAFTNAQAQGIGGY